jgi:NTP pyrophosphatase (non-canonical NTP hydrolase)
MGVTESEHAALRREAKQRDQTAKENAAVATRRGEEIERLKAELAEVLAEVMSFAGSYRHDGDMAGWYDTNAIGTAVEAGDRLVELGLWERHPDGYGRRWFYRPIKKESE